MVQKLVLKVSRTRSTLRKIEKIITAKERMDCVIQCFVLKKLRLQTSVTSGKIYQILNQKWFVICS